MNDGGDLEVAGETAKGNVEDSVKLPAVSQAAEVDFPCLGGGAAKESAGL